MKSFFLFILITVISLQSNAQIGLSDSKFPPGYDSPKTFEITEITVSGIEHTKQLHPDFVISVSGLQVGDIITIPGEEIPEAIKKIWDLDLVGDVQIMATKGIGSRVALEIVLTERPRISSINFVDVEKEEKFAAKGKPKKKPRIKKSYEEDLANKLDLLLGDKVTEGLETNTKNVVKKYYLEKGYFNVIVDVARKEDPQLENSVILNVRIRKGKKIKVNEIIFHGNEIYDEKKLQKKMKKTKEKRFYRIFNPSKYLKKEFNEDLQRVTSFYKSEGYRDAKIELDTIYNVDTNLINIEINVYEGIRYVFGDIVWTGNYIYDDERLNKILNIRKGQVYNSEALNTKLNFNPKGEDVSSLYLDNGYLFFSVDQVETLSEDNKIDIELRIYEGPQATIRDVSVSGNTKTHDHVILRELRTVPGAKFSRTDLIRTQQALAQLGYFEPDQIGINPIPDPENGTVDIQYTVVERASDQVQLSGGFGGGFGFVGTLRLVFNNFSLRNIGDFDTWSPLPSGDGQRLQVAFQASGRRFQTGSISFTEPWLGGKKPRSLTLSSNYSVQRTFNSDGSQSGKFRIVGGSVGLGARLRIPDDNFTISNNLQYLNYALDNFRVATLGINNGSFHSLTLTTTLARNSLNNFDFPTSGSSMSLSASWTPPYSLLDPAAANNQSLIEYQKYMFDNSWFIGFGKRDKQKLVLNIRSHVGFLGAFNKEKGPGPFERFFLGGDGLSGFNFFLGSEIVGLRGYENNSIVPNSLGGTIFDKFVFELRYLLSDNPVARIYMLSFLEGGNNWSSFDDFNPFQMYSSAGVGVRIFMPAFGLLGVDYGIGLDEVPGCPTCNEKRITFSIGQQIR